MEISGGHAEIWEKHLNFQGWGGVSLEIQEVKKFDIIYMIQYFAGKAQSIGALN